MYVRRTLERHVRALSRQFPVLMLTGARQVGKTTLLKESAEGRRYVTLDDPMQRELAREDPRLFLGQNAAPVLIDEIQYAPDLLPYIKMIVDDGAGPGSFWLTGSQPFHLMQGVSESLAGRVGIMQLMGFSQREVSGSPDASAFLPDADLCERELGRYRSADVVFERIFRGALPAFLTGKIEDRGAFFRSYVQTYLQRDVRELANVGDESAFLRFLQATAARTAQLLNVADLARDVDIAPNTAKRWLSILEVSGVIHILQPYHTNLSKRLVKAPKVHFLDSGLCAYLTQWNSPETLMAGALSGKILESWAFAEILKSFRHNGLEPPMYHYRDRDDREIDLLIVSDGVIHPVEVKKTATPRLAHVSPFKHVGKLDLPLGHGALLTLAPEVNLMLENVTHFPLAAM